MPNRMSAINAVRKESLNSDHFWKKGRRYVMNLLRAICAMVEFTLQSNGKDDDHLSYMSDSVLTQHCS